MEFELLGDLTVRNGSGMALVVAGARPRALLALLLLHAPSAVSTGRILDELWTGARAKDPMAALHTAVAKLRRALQPHAPGLVVTGPAGYRLDLTGHTVDVRLLDGELARARATEDPGRRAALLRAALDRWSGTPLAGLPALPFVQAERARLEALRLTVLEERADAELAAHAAAGGVTGGAAGGADPADLVEALRAAARADPDRERLHALLIRTLQACGRQAEALGVYRAARADLRERLGIEPGREMRAAQQAVLRGFSGTGTGTGTATATGTAPGTVRARRGPAADATAHPGLPHGADFVGRGPELAAIAAQLAEARLVTVTGTAGIGKTRLSLAAAAREQEAGATVWRVDLVPCSPADVPGAVAAALGIAPGPAETLADRMRLAIDRAPRCLLLLDNCEHLTEAAADLTARLLDACPRLRVLATSREGLGVAGESRLALRPLTDQDAIRLFLDRLARVSPPAARAANWDEVRDLCEAVDRLPLGIELVAPKAASTPLPVIVRQLRTRRGLLEVPLRSADARHGTLRAALDWSYRLITDEEREVWRAVSVFAAPFTVDAAEAVAGPGAGDTLALLAEKSLLVYDPGPGSPRYRMLVSLRQYARQALAERGEETGALRRHADWVAALAHRTDAALRTGSGPAAFAEMTAVTPEVACCLDWLQDSADPADRLLGSRIATHLSLYWMAAGQRQEGHRRLLRALESTPPTADWYAETLAWCGWLGVNIRRAGDDDELLRQALPAAEKRGDPAVVTLVGALALTAHVRQERLAEAREVARATVSALDEHGHRWETGVWQLFHSELLVAEDERRAALTSAMTARELLTTLDPHSAATAQIMTGMAYERLGERALSVRAFRAAHDELRLIGAEHEAAYAKAVLACAAAGDGDWDDATSFADALETYARESAEGYLLAKVETVRALAARARGDLDQAERLHLRASERYRCDNRPECAAHDLTMLGVVAAERGEAVLAQVRWEHALRTARLSKRRYAEALPLRGLIALREAQGDETAAAELRERLALTVREASPSRTTECPFHLAVSSIACDETARALSGG
ncbi:BTAD domain-containing putative transcriptional regulator [Streptomyces sp. Rer75]|uniref:AfsR/SARP family transcriptional regulator n=1 Tax=unclassified Streptomyces TaxID=2593676 RepID=UPI0015D02E92|nr:BTAD domain-containing putative transcriptional regulator [Streptomyces sp. Rer75]QLH24733.1 winged helix-turn-helix domain-containing protein [Streptomyces sp. Rer75]